MPHSLHSALIRSQTARENKSTRHISWPTLNNLECKNETVTMSSWVGGFFFFHYVVCFYIQTDFNGPDWNLLTWFKFFVGRWEVFFQKKKKKFNTRTGKFHIFLRQSPTQPLHFLMKSQHPQTYIVPAENNINNKKYIHTQNPFFALCIETYQSLHRQPHKVTKNLHFYLLQLNHSELTAQAIYIYIYIHTYTYIYIYIYINIYIYIITALIHQKSLYFNKSC